MSRLISAFKQMAEPFAGPNVVAAGQNLDADGYWSWAEARNTASAYRCFAFHYPKDSRAATARTKCAAPEWEKIEKCATRVDCRRFLRAHRDGEFVERVKQKQAKLAADVQALGIPSDTPLASLFKAFEDREETVRAHVCAALGRIAALDHQSKERGLIV